MRRTIVAVALALTVVLAGCAGAGGPTTTANTANGGGTGDTTTSGGSGGADAAALGFYVSDRPGAIDDFEHLNVTITRIGLHHTGNATAEGDENETSTTATTTTTTTTVAENETTTAERENETEQEETEHHETEHEETEHEETEHETERGSGYWVERDVNNTTVDLTQLRGENATLLENVSVPAGSYDKVFAYVSGVNGTLTSGEHVNVKLPSQKLHVNSEFTLGANDSTHFVYDVSVVKAGGSGKYIVKPVVSETGLGKSMHVVDHEREHERGECECGDGALDLSFAGNVTAGENATLTVTENGSAVANATVSVNGEEVGTTDANGTLTVSVPDDHRLRVTTEKADEHGMLTVRLDGDEKRGGERGGHGDDD